MKGCTRLSGPAGGACQVQSELSQFEPHGYKPIVCDAGWHRLPWACSPGLTTMTVSSAKAGIHSFVGMGAIFLLPQDHPKPQVLRWINDDGESVGFVRGYVGCKSASRFQQVGRTGSLGSAAHREEEEIQLAANAAIFWASISL